MMRRLASFAFTLLMAWSSLFSEEAQELVVKLPTSTPLLPMYVAQITSEDTEFDHGYLAKLQSVLRYDFDNNALTQLLGPNAEKEALAARSYGEPESALSSWRAAHVMYVIIPRVQANHLSLRLIAVNNQVVKELSDIALSGDLEEDRHRIHLVSDSVHHELFGVEGIATTRILYTKRFVNSTGKQVSEVWEADYDGSGARQITHDGAYCITPSYIPPAPGMISRQFVYVTYRWGPPKIMYASLKDGVGQRFTDLRGNQLLPCVSRQRDKVAFISDITGNPDLFVQPFSPEYGAVGKPMQVFSARGSTQGSPSFSPDGKKLAFVSDKAGQPQIYAMDLPTGGAKLKDLHPVLVSVKARNGTAPAWSPDGSKIVFCSQTKGLRQLWLYDVATRQEYQLTFGPANKENPSWAPDSLHLVYNTADAGDSELFLLDLHRLKPIKIELGEGEKRFPSWEPRSNKRSRLGWENSA